MNKFVLKLCDEYADARYEEVTSYYIVETKKSLTDVEEAYNSAAEEWENAEGNEFDCKIAHIQMRLHEKGMEMYPLHTDLELDF